jgi:TRAP-type C4-dicarboxylate transport system, small permease component
MGIVNAIHKLSDWVNQICATLCTVTISAMVLVTGAQIVCRLYFSPLVWSEELTRYLLVWSTFLGASCVYKKLGHINVTAIKDLFPPAVQTVLGVTAHLLCGGPICCAAGSFSWPHGMGSNIWAYRPSRSLPPCLFPCRIFMLSFRLAVS